MNGKTTSYVLDHADVKLMFIGKLDLPDWKNIQTGISADMPKIAYALAPSNDFEKWDDIMAKTAPIEGNPSRDVDDTALIIYTSGSTGQPKGVMHAFGRIANAVAGMTKELELSPDDRQLSYLPLAHVFERAYVECASIAGVTHVFFAEALDTFVQDLQRCRPTLFISVPRLWLKFQQGVFAKMPPKKLNTFLKIQFLMASLRRKSLRVLVSIRYVSQVVAQLQFPRSLSNGIATLA